MHFRLFNVHVYIHPTFWIFFIFFTNIYHDISLQSFLLGVVVILSLLVHEYGHALAARCFGAQPSITLDAFGGQCEYRKFGLSGMQHCLIILNGPLFQSLLIGLSYFLLKSTILNHFSFAQHFLLMMMRINLLWCLLNLLPITPLDGGQLLRFILEKTLKARAEKINSLIALVCALLIVPFLFYQGFFFFASLLLIFGLQHFQIFQQLKFNYQ